MFGAGVIAGYLLSENRKKSNAKIGIAYEEMNDILLEKDGRIDELENYIQQLLEKGEITEKKEPAGSKKDSGKEDLTKIEGIGPKTEKILNGSGIRTFARLAATSAEDLQKILAAAGPAFLRHNPETWAQQAKLAASGKWEALKKLQNS